MQTFAAIMPADVAARPRIMQERRALLERRYDLGPQLNPAAMMTRGKPLPVGPTAQLAHGMRWENFAAMTPTEIR